MSDADRPVAQAEPQLEDAVEAALGALLRDRDVTEVHCLEGGMLHVLRRGRAYGDDIDARPQQAEDVCVAVADAESFSGGVQRLAVRVGQRHHADAGQAPERGQVQFDGGPAAAEYAHAAGRRDRRGCVHGAGASRGCEARL